MQRVNTHILDKSVILDIIVILDPKYQGFITWCKLFAQTTKVVLNSNNKVILYG